MLRSQCTYEFFGKSAELRIDNANVLPTALDCMRHLMYLREQKTNGTTNTDNEARSCARRVMQIWEKAGIPTVTSETRLGARIKDIFDTSKKLKKIPVERRNSEKVIREFEAYKNDLSKLLDISACKCKSRVTCTCPRTVKVPECEWEFLCDQRSKRKMVISIVDRNETQRRMKRNIRIAKECDRNEKALSSSSFVINEEFEEGFEEYEKHTLPESQDEDFELPENPCVSTSLPRGRNLQKVSMIADRYLISDTAAAALCSATLQDIGHDKIVDRNKIRRERKMS